MVNAYISGEHASKRERRRVISPMGKRSFGQILLLMG